MYCNTPESNKILNTTYIGSKSSWQQLLSLSCFLLLGRSKHHFSQLRQSFDKMSSFLYRYQHSIFVGHCHYISLYLQQLSFSVDRNGRHFVPLWSQPTAGQHDWGWWRGGKGRVKVEGRVELGGGVGEKDERKKVGLINLFMRIILTTYYLASCLLVGASFLAMFSRR